MLLFGNFNKSSIRFEHFKLHLNSCVLCYDYLLPVPLSTIVVENLKVEGNCLVINLIVLLFLYL